MKRIITFCLPVIAAMMMWAAQPSSMPDFDELVAILERNRKIYNEYNDSLWTPATKQDWLNLYLKRAGVNSRIFAENSRVKAAIGDVFSGDSVDASNYYALYKAMEALEGSDSGDPFIIEEFCKLLLPFFEAHSGEYPYELTKVYLLYGQCKHEIALVGGASESQATFDFYHKALELGEKLPASQREPYILALTELSSVIWPRWRPSLLPMFYANREKLQECLEDSVTLGSLSPSTIAAARDRLAHFDYNLIRNLHFSGQSGLSEHEADSILNNLIAGYEATSDLSLRRSIHYLQLLYRAGRISPDDALERALRSYRSNASIPKGISSVDLYELHAPLLEIIFFNDMSSLPESAKNENAVYIASEIVKLFRAMRAHQTDNRHITILKKFIGYRRLTDHLSTAQKLDFINGLMVATQVSTYAHCVHVGKLSEILMDGVERYRPDLLPAKMKGVADWSTFAKEAASYHDIGKNLIVSVITNEYRPVSNHEYEIIRTHPKLGLNVLAIDSSLIKYRDVVLGHHKWYNGKGGYPADFDNTLSPVRTVIDVVTICDCLEAATDLVGRNYSKNKDFDVILSELEQESGTRYNPELIKLIYAHPDVYRAMKKSIEKDWVDIYFSIYEKFLKE